MNIESLKVSIAKILAPETFKKLEEFKEQIESLGYDVNRYKGIAENRGVVTW